MARTSRRTSKRKRESVHAYTRAMSAVAVAIDATASAATSSKVTPQDRAIAKKAHRALEKIWRSMVSFRPR